LTGAGDYDDFALLGKRGLRGINCRVYVAVGGADELLGFDEVVGGEVLHFSWRCLILSNAKVSSDRFSVNRVSVMTCVVCRHLIQDRIGLSRCDCSTACRWRVSITMLNVLNNVFPDVTNIPWA